MKVVLFLGSGISFPTKLPGLESITDSLLNDEWHIYSDQSFSPGPDPNPNIPTRCFVNRIQEFLKYLKGYANEYYSQRRGQKASYEDLFYLCEQIYYEELNEVENPAMQEFTKYIKHTSKDLFEPLPPTYFGFDTSLKELSSRACDLIQYGLSYLLYTNKTPDGLNLLTDIAKSDYFSSVSIFTTNQDILIEKIFTKNGVEYSDGFGETEGEIRYFYPELIDIGKKMKLIKLHGSINWYRFVRKINTNEEEERIGIPMNPDYWHCFDNKGHRVRPVDGKPYFLTGVYNKMLKYGFGIIAEMHYRFHEVLHDPEVQFIIMSGYGWNDRGMNARLMEWMLSDNNKHIILLHENPEISIKENSKSAMWHRYDRLVEMKKLIPVKKWLCNVNLNKIITIIESIK